MSVKVTANDLWDAFGLDQTGKARTPLGEYLFGTVGGLEEVELGKDSSGNLLIKVRDKEFRVNKNAQWGNRLEQKKQVVEWKTAHTVK